MTRLRKFEFMPAGMMGGAVAVVTPWNIVLARVLAGAVAVLNPWVLVLVGLLAGRGDRVLWLW